MPDLGATSDCLTNNRKTEDKEARYYCFLVLLVLNFIQFRITKIALI